MKALCTLYNSIKFDYDDPSKFLLLSYYQVYKIFEDEDPESALENAVDKNLRGSFPMDDVYKVSPVYYICLSWMSLAPINFRLEKVNVTRK